MTVHRAHNAAEFASVLECEINKHVVVGFRAASDPWWIQTGGPYYNSLSRLYTGVMFVEAEHSDVPEAVKSLGLHEWPTFVVYSPIYRHVIQKVDINNLPSALNRIGDSIPK